MLFVTPLIFIKTVSNLFYAYVLAFFSFLFLVFYCNFLINQTEITTTTAIIIIIILLKETVIDGLEIVLLSDLAGKLEWWGLQYGNGMNGKSRNLWENGFLIVNSC